jgi:hypothetical protein
MDDTKSIIDRAVMGEATVQMNGASMIVWLGVRDKVVASLPNYLIAFAVKPVILGVLDDGR